MSVWGRGFTITIDVPLLGRGGSGGTPISISLPTTFRVKAAWNWAITTAHGTPSTAITGTARSWQRRIGFRGVFEGDGRQSDLASPVSVAVALGRGGGECVAVYERR